MPNERLNPHVMPKMGTEGTMVGVPTEGMNEMFKPDPAGPKTLHGSFPEGGNQKVMPKGGMTKDEYPSVGGNQIVKP